MDIFRTLGTLIKPRKIEFIKRLVAKRLDYAPIKHLARSAPMGSTQYTLRRLNLSSMEFLSIPETTVANVLEQYWTRHDFYSRPIGLLVYASDEDRAQERKSRITSMIGQIEYSLTGIPDAAIYLPPGLDLVAYIRYRIGVEYPAYGDLKNYGISDDFINYAIDESKYVFGR